MQGCSAKKRGVGKPFPHQTKRKTAPNRSNNASIRLQEFPRWIFLFHCSRLLISSAHLRVAICEIAAMFQCNRLDPTSSSNRYKWKKVWERCSHPTTPLLLSPKLIPDLHVCDIRQR